MTDKTKRLGLWGMITTKPEKTPRLERFEQKSEIPMLILAILMLVGILLPRFYTVPEQWLLPLEIFDWFIWAVFFIEFVIRIWLAPKKWHYTVNNWLDVVIVVLPAIRVIRIFRALRILRSLRLLRVFSVGYKRAGSLKSLSRRSKFDFVVVAATVLMKPVALGVSVVLLSFLVKENSSSPLLITLADQTLRLTGLLFGAYFFNLVFVKEILVYSIRYTAQQAESSYDQILVLIIERLAPPIILAITTLFFLQLLGINTSALSVMIGGASFILAFALQEALSNIFSGLFLTIETPFKFGEIIRLPDLGICEVRRVGLRATELYLVEENTVVSIPNSDMASQTIVNLSRPLPDLLVSLPLGVAYGTDVKKSRAVVLKIMNANPYVVGDPTEKIPAIKAALKKNIADEE